MLGVRAFRKGFTMARKPHTATVLPAPLSIDQAAECVGVSRDTIRRRIADGTLPAHRMGPKLIRIHPADLERLYRPIPAAAGGATG